MTTLRDKWDDRFLRLAVEVATWSKDPSSKFGAVIVRPDRTVASLGFNGFPRGVDDSAEFYADRELKYARVVHAEVNSILHARTSVEGCTMFVAPGGSCPTCDRCATVVIQAGITRVVCAAERSEHEHRWADSLNRALAMYTEAGVKVSLV